MKLPRPYGYPTPGVCIGLLVFALALVALVMVAGYLAISVATAMPAQAVFHAESTVPWYVMLAIICLPGVVAVTMTIIAVTVVRRVNRADGNPPLSARASVLWTVGFGAVFGPLCQWTLQELSSELSGVDVNWKLIVIAPFITGLTSMAVYEALRAYCRTRYPVVYALLSVKHPDVPCEEQNGDVTRMYRAQGADDVTEPKG